MPPTTYFLSRSYFPPSCFLLPTDFKGTYRSSDSDSYAGEWVADKMEGVGKFTHCVEYQAEEAKEAEEVAGQPEAAEKKKIEAYYRKKAEANPEQTTRQHKAEEKSRASSQTTRRNGYCRGRQSVRSQQPRPESRGLRVVR